jgi:hypothetical protein
MESAKVAEVDRQARWCTSWRSHCVAFSRQLESEAISVKDTKTKKELAMLVADAIEAVVSATRVMPPFIEGHIRDGMGRNWDVSMRAPTPVHRKAIDSVRDTYDLK